MRACTKKLKNKTCAIGGVVIKSTRQSPVVTTERSYYMATEKIGVYRRWLEPAPNENGEAVPQSSWPVKRRYSWSVRWFGTDGKRYSKSISTRKEADRFARQLQQKVLDGKQDKPKDITLGQFRKEHLQLMRGQVAYATLWIRTGPCGSLKTL